MNSIEFVSKLVEINGANQKTVVKNSDIPSTVETEVVKYILQQES